MDITLGSIWSPEKVRENSSFDLVVLNFDNTGAVWVLFVEDLLRSERGDKVDVFAWSLPRERFGHDIHPVEITP